MLYLFPLSGTHMTTNSKWIIMLTIMVAIITPFANDTYIASLPSIGIIFHTNKAQLIVSTFLAGLAISQLFYGPLLDRFGRKPVVLVGLIIYTIATIVILHATNINTILVARFFEAVGACSTITTALAIIRDSFPREKTLFYVALVMGMIAVCPTVAPILGSYFQQHFGWRGTFYFLLVLGVFFLIFISGMFKDSMQQKNLNAVNMQHLIANYKKTLRHTQFLGFILTSCLSYSTLFAYIAFAPYLMMNLLHIPIEQFGWYFSLSGLGIITMNFVAPKLGKKIGLPKVLRIGALFITLGSLVLLGFDETNHLTIATLIISMMLVSCGIGFIRPTASAGAMNIFPPQIAGSAAAMFGFFSFIGGSISSMIVSNYIKENILFFILMIMCFGLFSLYTSSLCFSKKTSDI